VEHVARRIGPDVVPARLMGHMVEVRVHANVVETLYGDYVVQTMPRLRRTVCLITADGVWR
jgi:hypothetical protein